MPDENGLTQRELLRYLKESIDATRELRAAIDQLRGEIASTYVRKDVYEADRRADSEAGRDLNDRVNSLVSLRDWALKIVVGAVLLALLGLVLVSNNGGPPL